MTKFDKPGTKEGDYPDWAKDAGAKAARGTRASRTKTIRAGIRRIRVRRLDLRASERLYGLGLTGIPVLNVNNNCSTGLERACSSRAQAVKGRARRLCASRSGFREDGSAARWG